MQTSTHMGESLMPDQPTTCNNTSCNITSCNTTTGNTITCNITSCNTTTCNTTTCNTTTGNTTSGNTTTCNTTTLQPSRSKPSILSTTEVRINAALWSAIALYSSYRVYDISQSIDIEDNSSFEDGWSLLKNKRNTSDWEWESYRRFIISAAPYLLLHVALSSILQYCGISSRLRFNILSSYGALVLSAMFGWTFTFVVLCIASVYYLVTVVTGTIAAAWALTAVILYTLNNHTLFNVCIEFIIGRTTDYTPEYYHVSTFVLFSVSLTVNRLISFNHELLNNRKQQQQNMMNYGYWDGVSYAFYLPVMFTGPLMNYDEFVAQRDSSANRGWSKERLLTLVKKTCRVAFWMLFVDFTLHYLYFSYLLTDEQYLSQTDKWTLVGVAFCQGQFFMVKYIVIFGIPSIMTSIDGIESATGPKCISRIYKYSDTWKYFDRGLYNFIQKYVYQAVKGSSTSALRRLQAALVAFVYIWFWHGASAALLVWAGLNFAGIAFESLGVTVLRITTQKQNAYFSPESILRLHAACAVPLLFVSTISAIIFFTNTTTGVLYLHRLLTSYDSIALLCLGLYCHVQTSMYATRCERNNGNVSSKSTHHRE